MHRRLALMGVALVLTGCARVRPGIDVLLSDSLPVVRDRRVGLLTNQSGVDAHGVGDVERLRGAGVRLVAIFSPEHGFRGAADPGAAVAPSTDSATGLPIYSLYGPTSAPTDAMLDGIDVMLVDLQDAGARYFTYLSTTVEVMRAAGRRGIRVVVLDRPNPIGGAVQGNVLDTAFASFVGRIAVPMRHGLTLGELARLAAADLATGPAPTVVPVASWRRAELYDATGLPFVPPSPNLRSLESLLHYPGLCLFEGTNLSVGRGSAAPFEQIGAPWLDTTQVLAALAREPLPGVAVEAVAFTPRHPGDGKYADTAVAGLHLRITDRRRYDAPAAAVRLLALLRHIHPGTFRFSSPQFDRLAGGPALRNALEAGVPPGQIIDGWRAPTDRFVARRAPFLLYHP